MSDENQAFYEGHQAANNGIDENSAHDDGPAK
jgi:hypothetical protein